MGAVTDGEIGRGYGHWPIDRSDLFKKGEIGGLELTSQFPNAIPNCGSGDIGEMELGPLEYDDSAGELMGVVGMPHAPDIITPEYPYCLETGKWDEKTLN